MLVCRAKKEFRLPRELHLEVMANWSSRLPKAGFVYQRKGADHVNVAPSYVLLSVYDITKMMQADIRGFV